MFDAILNNPELFGIRRETCEENDICIEFDSQLQESDYIILKIDAYYHSKDIHNPPPSIDCLIIVKCKENKGFDFYLVELRGTKNTQGFKVDNIRNKFKTTVEDFLKNKFASIFLADYRLNSLKVYFVSEILSRLDDETYRKKIERTRLKSLKDFKLEFKNKVAFISPELPNPLINPC